MVCEGLVAVGAVEDRRVVAPEPGSQTIAANFLARSE